MLTTEFAGQLVAIDLFSTSERATRTNGGKLLTVSSGRGI